jgi:hypothetical protein
MLQNQPLLSEIRHTAANRCKVHDTGKKDHTDPIQLVVFTIHNRSCGNSSRWMLSLQAAVNRNANYASVNIAEIEYHFPFQPAS